MSVSKNPDFWRSQEVGKPKPAPTGDALKDTASSDAPKTRQSSPSPSSPKTPVTPNNSAPSKSSSKAPLPNNGTNKDDNETGDRGQSGLNGARIRMTPSDPTGKSLGASSPVNDISRRSSGRTNSGTGSNPNVQGNNAANPSQQRGATVAGSKSSASAKATSTEEAKTSQQGKASGVAADKSAEKKTGQSPANAKTAPKKPESTADNKAKTGVLNKETGKDAAKEGLKQGAKGAIQGAMKGGLAGAAAGAATGAAAGAADKINEKSDALKQAGTTRGQSNAGGLLDSSSSDTLDRGRAEMLKRYGAPASGGSSAFTPEQAASIAKATKTVAVEAGGQVAKKVATGAAVAGALAYVMVMTTISATTAPIVAAVSAYSASSVSCDKPADETSVAAPGSKGTEDGLKPAAIKTQRKINEQWGAKIADIYGVRQGANALDHAEGRALDVMLADYKTPEANALGHEIADYFVANAKEYGISYIIFDSKIWANGGSPDSSWTYSGNGQKYGPSEWAPYNLLPGAPNDDNQQHRNHVHISTFVEPGGGVTLASAVTKLPTLDMQRASNVNALVNSPIVSMNVSDLKSNPSKYGLAPSLVDQQIENAKAIIGMSKTVGFNEKGAIIGIMVSLTETDLRNLKYGDAVGPDSRGLFQQRTTMGWGTEEQVTNPAYASQAFFLGVGGNANPGLQSVSGWQEKDPWVAAQAVQRSGFPDGSNYQSKHEFAKNIVDALYASTNPTPVVTEAPVNQPDGSANTTTSTNGCTTATAGDSGNMSTAAGDTYPAKNESYCWSESCYAEQAADTVSGGGYRGECVDWAGWKLLEGTGTYGTHRVVAMGNAGDWGASAKSKGIAVDMNPRAGDAVYWLPGQGGSGSAGHIATVQAVNGSKITIEEYNYGTVPGGGSTPETGGGRYHTRVIDASNASGYIHFLDVNKSKDENKAYLIEKGVLVPGKTAWPRTT